MDPTITDPETSEDPAEEPGEITMDGADLNDDAVPEQTITITDWAKLSDKVDIKASVKTKESTTETTIDAEGKIKAAKDSTLILNIVPKAGYKMAANDETVVTGAGTVKKNGYNYSFTVTGDMNVGINVAEIAYTLSVDSTNGGKTASITLDESMRTELTPAVTGNDPVVVTGGETKTIKGGSVAKDLKFTVVRTADEETNGKLHVYAKIDDSAENDELTSAAPVTDTEKKTVTYSYTVSAAETALIEETIKIVLVNEERTSVTVTPDATKQTAVLFKTVKATADSKAEEGWADSTTATDPEGLKIVKSAFAGETFEFKPVVTDDYKETYAIKDVEVLNGKKAVSVSSKEDVYSFVMPEDVDTENGGISIQVTADISAASGHSLTFSMAEGSDKGSATAKITEIVTSVKPATEGGEATPKTYVSGGTDDKGDLDSYPGLAGKLTLEEDKPLRIPQPNKNETITQIKVEVESAGTTKWALAKVDPTEQGQPAATKCTYTFKASPDASKNEIALDAAMTLSVATEVVKADKAKAFNVTIKEPADGETQHLKDFTVPSQTGVTAPPEAATKKYYKVDTTAASVNFTVKADPGYALVKPAGDWFRSWNPVTAADGTTTYTVSIFTSQLADVAVEGETDNTVATEIVLEAATGNLLTVKINPDKENGAEPQSFDGFTVERSYTPAGADAETNTEIDGTSMLSYGGEYKAAIKPDPGYHLEKVSYSVNEGAAQDVTPELDDNDKEVANIAIKPLNGNVVITVKTEKDYALTDLLNANGTPVDEKDDADNYIVEYKNAYLVGLKQGGKQIDVTKNIRAELKDENGAKVTVPRVVVSATDEKGNPVKMLKINLAGHTALRGQEITIDMLVDGTVVGTYYLKVNKATTAITINEGNDIEKQPVGSTMYYPITFDGEGVTAETDNETNTLKGVTAAIVDGRLQVTVPDMAFKEAVNFEVKDNKNVITSYKEAVVTVKATDNDVEQTVKVTAEPLFNPTDVPSVDSVDGGASDTTIWLTVGGMNEKAPKGDVNAGSSSRGRLYYEIEAKAKDKRGEDANALTWANSDASKVLEQNPTVDNTLVTKDSGTYRVELYAGKFDEDGNRITKLGAGGFWTYQVRARLVYKNASNGAVEESAWSEYKDFDTIDTYFASTLKLTKEKTFKGTLYTGQNNEITIATPNFTDKTVNYKIVEATVNDENSWWDSDGEYHGIEAYYIDGKIVVTGVSTDAAIGKHTLTVTAAADKTTGHKMYAARATMNVTVARGITSLGFSGNYLVGNTNSIYRQDGKTASVKLTSSIVYNDTVDKKLQPKNKKVEWHIVKPDYRSGDAMDNVAGVSVKNGTVTIGKDFVLDTKRGHEKNNQFRVLVKAADYEENTRTATSCIFTVTDTPLEVKNLTVAKYNEDTKKYKVLAVQTGNTPNPVEAKDLNQAQVFVLTNPAAVNQEYTQKQWDRLQAIDPCNFTYASNNKKLLSVDIGGGLKALGAGKKVNIKVTANDGKKANGTLVLDMGWTDNKGQDLALKVTATGDDKNPVVVYDPKKVDADASANYSVAGTPILDIRVIKGDKDNNTSTSFPDANDVTKNFTNYKLTVKGAKLVTVGPASNPTSYYVANAEKTVITLTDPSKDKKSGTYKLTLTNAAYAKGLDKATVKFTKGSTLHEWGTAKEQELPLTITKGKDSFGTGMVAKVEIDKTALSTKNWQDYRKLANALNSRNTNGAQYFVFDKDNMSTKLTFGTVDTAMIELTPGSYKLKVTVGSLSGSKFTPKSQAASVTLKVAKNKTFTFKPTTSYQMNGVDGAAVITGRSNVNLKNGEFVIMDGCELQNMNIDGKSNLFTHYFKVEVDEKTGTWYLKLNLKDDEVVRMMYTVETDKDGNEVRNADGTLKTVAGSYHVPDLTKLDKNKCLTGYLKYSTWSNVNYYGYDGKQYGIVKITVKPVANPKENAKSAKASQKYVPSNTELALTAGSEMPVNITVNNAYVGMSYAIIDESKSKQNSEALTLGGTNGVNADGQVVLKVADKQKLEADGKYATNLLVIPANSLYKELIDNPQTTPSTPAAQADGAAGTTTDAAAARKALIEKYGIAVKVNVVGKTKPNETKLPVIDNGSGDDSGSDVEKEIEQAVLEAVSKVDITLVPATDVTIAGNAGAETATLVDSGKAKIKTAVESAASGFTAEVKADALTSVSVTDSKGTAVATVTLSRAGYKTKDVSLTVKIGEESTAPTISKVEIWKENGSNAITTDSVEITNADVTVKYLAKVYATTDGKEEELSSEEVTWEVTAESGSTKADGTKFAGADGTLTVSKDQTAGTLKVTATSKTNAEKKAEVTLTITNNGGGGSQ